MNVTRPRSRFEDVVTANQQLVDHFLKNGDAENRAFRRTCYAAAADTLNRHLLDEAQSFSDQQREQLRTSLRSAIRESEAIFEKQDGGLENTVISTSLDAPGWTAAYFQDGATPPAASDQARPSTTSIHFGKWVHWLGAAAFGASAALLAALALHLLGVVHVYFRADSFAQFRNFDAGVTQAAPIIDRSMAAVRKLEERLIAATKDNSLDKSAIHTKFVPVSEIYPDLATELRPLLPASSALIARMIPGPEIGYKILVVSEYCAAVNVLDPAKVDPVRASNRLFCRYYGLWTDNAQAL